MAQASAWRVNAPPYSLHACAPFTRQGDGACWALCTPTLSPCRLGQQLGPWGAKDAWESLLYIPWGLGHPEPPPGLLRRNWQVETQPGCRRRHSPLPRGSRPASPPPRSSQEPDSWCEGRARTSTSGVRPAPAWGASLTVTGTRRGLCTAWWEGFCLLFHPCLPSNVPLKKQQDREKVNY